MVETKKKENCVLTNMVKTNLDIVNRHINVLKTLQRKQPIGVTELSEETKYPRHKVAYSLTVLEEEGLVEPSVKGAVTTENVEGIIKRIKNSILDVSTSYNELLKKLE